MYSKLRIKFRCKTTVSLFVARLPFISIYIAFCNLILVELMPLFLFPLSAFCRPDIGDVSNLRALYKLLANR